MGLFGDKKKNSQDLNQLSEEEIQKKLYGTFTKTPEPKTHKPSYQDSQRSQREVKEGVNRPNIVAPKNPLNESLPSEDRDLFSESEVQESTSQIREQETVTQTEEKPAEFKRDQGRLNAENGQRPENTAFKYSPKPEFKPKKKDNFYSKPKPSPKLENVKKLLEKKQNGFQKWLKDAGFFLQEFLTSAFETFADALQGSLQFIYRKRKFFKKVAIGGVAVALLFVLFSSVHYLNVKRKEAMSGEKPAASSESSNVVAATASATPNTERSDASTRAQNADSNPLTTREATVESNSVAAPATSAPTVGDGRFVVQIATYVTRDDAQRVVDQFNAEAWKSFVREMSRTGGRTFYSVYLGRFADYDTAQQVFNDFKQTELAEPFQDAFIRTLSSE